MPRIQAIGDKIAIALSSLCVVHCIITPILLIALPALGGVAFLDHEVFHQILLFFVLPVGVIAITAGYRHHKSAAILGSGLLGLLLLTLAGTIAHDLVGEIGETVLTIVASLFIVYAHIQNYRQRHHRR
ncbi:MerC domain-containing protein [Alteromonas confluentis]|uniref:MerC mercury resistance protein n=1 Tax=Alteromonas confluentis TaxID=1656094 RepID=A0A1E7Z9Z1_9ALTE|nr:MerC domain-containing protein [Alteromonas confluentis]OFC70340.1 hypothetical protein BFC18_14300 [Alteromonas confluentis]